MLKKVKEKYLLCSEAVKAGIWFAFCSAFQQAVNFLLTPLFARYLSVEEYGMYNLYATWNGIFTILITLNVAGGIFNNAMIKFKERIHEYMSSMQGLVIVIASIMLLVCTIFQPVIDRFVKLPLHWLFLMFFQITANLSFSLWSAKERFEFRYKRFAVITICSVVIQAILSLMAVIFAQNKVEAKIIVSVIIQCAIGVYFYVAIFVKSHTFYKREHWSYALRFAIPLLPHYLSQVVLNQSDRIMISSYCGEAELGYYSMAYNISVAISFLTTSINTVYIPYTYRCLEIKEKISIKKTSKALILALFVCVILVCLFAPEVILFLGSKKYIDSVWVVPPIICSLFFVFVYTLFANIEFYYEKKGFITLASGSVAIINLVLNYIFIPVFGYAAAAYTTLACYLLYALIHYLFMKYSCKEDAAGVYDMKYIGIISSIVLIVAFAVPLLYSLTTLLRYLVIGIILIIIFFFRNKIIEMLRSICKN